MAALLNGEQINFTKVGSDAQISPRTIKDYFSVLEDTLVGTLLPAYTHTKSRKAVSTAKFYFFDVGVAHGLNERWSFKEKSQEYGRALEHFIFLEMRAALSYLRSDKKMFYWRSQTHLEVDFLLHEKSEQIAIEVKASKNVSMQDLKRLQALKEDIPELRQLVVGLEAVPRRVGCVEILPVDDLLERLWSGSL